MHGRTPRGQLHALYCLHGSAGRILDVAVDLRAGSPTYRGWVAVELAADEPTQLWVPPGFAHGFCVLGEGAEVTYKMSAYYSPEHDRAVRWDDPQLGVRWPLAAPVVSARDAAAPRLAEVEPVF